MSEQLPTNFDPAWIRTGFSTKWCSDNSVTFPLAVASTFNKKMPLADRENKVVLGLLLSVATPNKGTAYGMSLYTTNGGAKRTKVQANYAFIMVFADLMDLPNCFAVILHRKSDFQNLFNAKSNCEHITIGDPVCFVEPSPTDDKLGEKMTVLKAPGLAVALNYQSNWPMRDLQISDYANRQVAFHISKKKITVSSVMMKGGHQTVGCNHSMCDRQNIRCQGCYGQAPTLWAVVLQCDVTVHDVTNWNATDDGTAGFADFRSWRFSNLFFHSPSYMSTHEGDDFEEQQHGIRRTVKEIVKTINAADGWTIIGWHRRGTKSSADDAEEVLANRTAGHISCLMPTNPANLDACTKYNPNPAVPAPAAAIDPLNNEGQHN